MGKYYISIFAVFNGRGGYRYTRITSGVVVNGVAQ
jgi:hypothetical protein